MLLSVFHALTLPLVQALQARTSAITTVPSKALVAKRLSQCLNPVLPSGVHQKTLEVYHYVFTMIGKDGLSRDLPLYLPGLASTLSFASLSVRSPFLDLLERHFLDLNPRSLRPALKSVVLALLPGLEDETAEDYEQTLKLMDRFKVAIRPADSEEITPAHSPGDSFFWQCFFLASITSQSRRAGALAYLVRNLPSLGHPLAPESSQSAESEDEAVSAAALKIAQLVTSPEPGLLLRCFAAGLTDENLLIQRGYLDLLVTHLPLHSRVLQTRVKPTDFELLLRAAVGVVTRREMSLNRRLWAWLLGPEPTAGGFDSENLPESPSSLPEQHAGHLTSKTGYFEQYGLQALTRSLLATIKASEQGGPAERARPYRICLSLMDRWEIGGLVVPEVFLPVVDSVRKYKAKAPSKLDFGEVLRSASVFFDGVESGLIFGELLGLLAPALGPGDLESAERSDRLALVKFVLTHFNVREEEMIMIHAPLTALSILCMLEEAKHGLAASDGAEESNTISAKALGIAGDLLELVPERAFLPSGAKASSDGGHGEAQDASTTVGILKVIKSFYVNDQGSLEATSSPLTGHRVGELLLQKACSLNCEALHEENQGAAVGIKSRILLLLLTKAPAQAPFDDKNLLNAVHDRLATSPPLDFVTFSSLLSLATILRSSGRVSQIEISEIVLQLVRHAWFYLSTPEPKYHVETVRGLWQLQTALGAQNRDIEAAISSLITQQAATADATVGRSVDAGRTFGVLWSHTLQDNPSSSDRRGPKTPRIGQGGEFKPSPLRLAGMDHYDVMLTRPLFLVLDALTDDRGQLFMSVKSWLNTLNGANK